MQLLQGSTKASDNLSTGQRRRLQTLLFVFIALGPVEREPDRLQRLRIVGAAREQMPVQVGHLIAEQFAIQLARLEGDIDGLSERDHFLKKRGANLGRQVMQFGRMNAGDEDAVAGVILPGAEQGDGMVKLPNDIVGA